MVVGALRAPSMSLMEGQRLGAARPAAESNLRMMDAAIAFEGVSFAYGGRPVFENLTLAVRPGEILGLLGRNGAGKTTWLNLAGGWLQPAAGVVRLQGRSLREVPRLERARTVGLVPQELHIPFPFS